jgi:pSer/pThr/pTyr-binding forkhead associated (FHA) protein
MTDEEFGLRFILDSGKTWTFNSLPIRMGRAEQNEITILDDTVSSVHAQVYFDDLIGDICIQDLDSLNGLLIGDLPTRKNVLQDGVRIGLGNARLTFRDTGYIHAG